LHFGGNEPGKDARSSELVGILGGIATGGNAQNDRTTAPSDAR